jgi:hypothetical protein
VHTIGLEREISTSCQFLQSRKVENSLQQVDVLRGGGDDIDRNTLTAVRTDEHIATHVSDIHIRKAFADFDLIYSASNFINCIGEFFRSPLVLFILIEASIASISTFT